MENSHSSSFDYLILPSLSLRLLSHDDEDSDYDYVETKHDLEDDDFDCVVIKNELEDDDADEVLEARSVNRGSWFVVKDEDNDGHWANIESTSEEKEDEVEELKDDDVVEKALQKCSKMSFGPVVFDRYAEVEAALVRIVNQVPFLTFTELFVDDIIEACRSEDSNFQPILKPYQLVGVHFLLLLYQKGIGGGTYFFYSKDQMLIGCQKMSTQNIKSLMGIKSTHFFYLECIWIVFSINKITNESAFDTNWNLSKQTHLLCN
ncbi:SWI/SNF-related matrix-associated actin-dependent regulated protein 1B [Pyrus ussuriensis x Pyrus communis]|uniref:SWI/SNF-related matrix-associated actin-dependent regulated protein 1B n=1 Tax=Pyrus ussuriensis x Pyrus communis TaxID=2448454 RepID=A0A5N5FZB6_9ROSA|nr:SWI/SNF-related matrix-associated actin-dependent regulated protein 1B [Pyrus ussuriensis x Pyrus communis]